MLSNDLKNDLQLKWSRIQETLQQTDYDACLLSIDVNLYYVSGQIFNGYFYIEKEGAPFFFIKRPSGVNGENIYSIRKPEQFPELFGKMGKKMPKSLYLESDELPYTEYMRLFSIFNPEKTQNATHLLRKLRMIKTPWEIEQFRISAKAHAKTYSQISECFRPGMTDIEFQYNIEEKMRKNGSIGMFRAFGTNMDIFMGSILAGDNASTPSAFDFALGGAGQHPSCPIGANGTVLKEGMSIMVDMAGNYTAYMTDMTRVFSVGSLSPEAYKAHQTALKIQEEIEKAAKPGTICSTLYDLALLIVEKEGLEANFMGTKQQAKFIGHGVGIQINELPVLTARSKEVLEPGTVFALEPKFVIPGTGAVGIENTFLVTESGVEKLTLFEESIIQLH